MELKLHYEHFIINSCISPCLSTGHVNVLQKEVSTMNPGAIPSLESVTASRMWKEETAKGGFEIVKKKIRFDPRVKGKGYFEVINGP